MTLPNPVSEALTACVGGPVRRAEPVGGGCIARATRVETDTGVFFLKYGSGEVAHTFPAEAAGLRALQEAGSPLVVPDVLGVILDLPDGTGALVLEWIEPGSPGRGFWESFGRGLVELHGYTQSRYGFDRDNFIGRMPQQNGWMESWPAFFRERRLAPQVRWARARGRWQAGWDALLDGVYRRLEELLPSHPPASLLHGDLWSGNYMATAEGRAAIIDPAAYFGHREADLAMTELFGGYPERFYAAYRDAWPLEAGYAERRDIYNLYHLINHLNLFGAGYAGSVAAILERYA